LAGLASFALEGDRCQLVCLDSVHAARGCGRALLQAVIDFARSEGCKKLEIRVGNNNLHAVSFFQKNGFAMTGILPGEMARQLALMPGAIAPGDAEIQARDLIVLEFAL